MPTTTAKQALKHRGSLKKADVPESASRIPAKKKINGGMKTRLDSAEAALIDSELRYRRLFEAAQDGILILEFKTGLITDVNPFLIKLLDYTREEFVGKALWDIGLFKDIESSKSAFRELQEKHYVRYENLPLETKDGRSINVEFVSNVYGVKNKKVIQCNIRDITKRVSAERTEQQIFQARQLESIGQLAGGIAHDFNNLLQVILGYCDLLDDSPNLDPTEHGTLAKISDAGQGLAPASIEMGGSL